MTINDFDICYMLNVCVSVVSLSQPSCRVIINDFVKCLYLLYVKCLCLSVVSLSQPSSRVIINDFGIC